MAKAPLAVVKERFKSKEALVAAVRDLAKGDLWIDREVSQGLDRAPNARLLRLHDILSDAKKRFGSRDKIVDAIVQAEGRGKEKDYRARFAKWPVPRLIDRLESLKPAKAAKGARAKA